MSEEKNGQSKVFPPDGKPCRAEVDALLTKWPSELLTSGTKIYYSHVAADLGTTIRSSRFNVVTRSWRKRLFTMSNIVFECCNDFFLVASNSGRVLLATGGINSGLRKIKKNGKIAETTSITGLSADELLHRAHIVKLSATLSTLAKTERKALVFDLDAKKK